MVGHRTHRSQQLRHELRQLRFSAPQHCQFHLHRPGCNAFLLGKGGHVMLNQQRKPKPRRLSDNRRARLAHAEIRNPHIVRDIPGVADHMDSRVPKVQGVKLLLQFRVLAADKDVVERHGLLLTHACQSWELAGRISAIEEQTCSASGVQPQGSELFLPVAHKLVVIKRRSHHHARHRKHVIRWIILSLALFLDALRAGNDIVSDILHPGMHKALLKICHEHGDRDMAHASRMETSASDAVDHGDDRNDQVRLRLKPEVFGNVDTHKLSHGARVTHKNRDIGEGAQNPRDSGAPEVVRGKAPVVNLLTSHVEGGVESVVFVGLKSSRKIHINQLPIKITGRQHLLESVEGSQMPSTRVRFQKADADGSPA
mmetsp:Transcript_6317/g.14545  ORF Transcript_6317/g.14545 Transcript_6317/m.14545 type:complete len:370 (-) Transcript_6317:416-1525(-)